MFRGIALGQTSRPTLPPAESLGPDIEIELEKQGERVEALVIHISDTRNSTSPRSGGTTPRSPERKRHDS